jgi:hypothetical protein
MAITLNQEYIVVEDVSPSQVTIRFHADAAHRARYKAGTETKYEGTKQETRNVPVDMLKLADSTVSIKDNNIIAGYTALKTLEEFTTAIDA